MLAASEAAVLCLSVKVNHSAEPTLWPVRLMCMSHRLYNKICHGMLINILVKLALKDMKTVVLFKLVKSESCGDEHDFEVFSARRLPTNIFWGT